MSEPVKENSMLNYLQENPHKGFKPVPHYFPNGDYLEWCWNDEAGWAEQINHDGVAIGCVFHSFKTGKIVGVKIYGVGKTVEQTGERSRIAHIDPEEVADVLYRQRDEIQAELDRLEEAKKEEQ